MSRKSANTTDDIGGDAMAQAVESGIGNLVGLSSAWMEALGDMGAEVAGFVAERIREDVKTQQDLMNCKTPDEVQHVQAEFVQKAIDQYRAETGKLVEMTNNALAGKSTDDNA